MEEADLLRERLQAITDKRKIREDIAKKRREIEDVKFDLQYLKKKALREQWLMDGMSGNEQDEETARAQAQKDQHQTEFLQSQIQRIETEIQDLETQELNLSRNEELILKQLKEVERTAEDIIKEVNGDFAAEPIQYIYSAIPDIPKSFTPTPMRRFSNNSDDCEAEKKALYAVEISVEKDLRTGKSQVLSSAPVAPHQLQRKGIKVYDDGRKSVYAVRSSGQSSDDVLDELSPLDVEELLQKAAQRKNLSDVEYHEPVFSSLYGRSWTPNIGEQGKVSPGLNASHVAREISRPLKHEDKISSWDVSDGKNKDGTYTNTNNMQKGCDVVQTNESDSTEELEEPVKLIPVSDSQLGLERCSPIHLNDHSMINELDFKPVTMIFMGYQNAESDEEDEKIQAELVVIGHDSDEESQLSYHPQGCHSKIFQPWTHNVHRSEIRPSALRYHTRDLNVSGQSVSVAVALALALSSSLLLLLSQRSASEEFEALGRKVNEDHFLIQSQTQAETQPLSDSVTMETSEESTSDHTIDRGLDAQVSEDAGGEEDGRRGDDDDLLESQSAKMTSDILVDLQTAEIHHDEEPASTKEALVLEDAHEELNRNGSITSSVSDTPSSTDSEVVMSRQDTVKDVLPAVDDEDHDTLDPLKAEFHQAFLESLECREVDDLMLESFIREEVMSDLSNESGQNPEDLDECLLVEIAAASSDSETDEKWRTIFSSSINKEDDDSYLDSLQLSAQELFVQKSDRNEFEPKPSDVKQDTLEDVVPGEEVLEQPENVSAYTPPPQEISYNPSSLFHALSKISEDEEDLGKGSNHKESPSSCVKPDPNKKVPKDFCVIQETRSENVSTEHVDFQVTRNQWLQMEEQTKNLAYPLTSRTSTCQGNHSTMYTPVRTIDRNKKDPDLEGLPLKRDSQHTQFSPCSEDSGVDDSSYRSPYDDPETPSEKIGFTTERDETLRRERMSKSYSSDCVPGKGKPVILNSSSLRQDSDERRKPWEDDSKLSPSAIMPSFIVTSSPTKGPPKHELAANNIIILEPEPCRQGPRHPGRLTSSKSADWRSEDTPSLIILETANLIIRSASDFNLNSAVEVEEKTFLSNPFFKLRSRSTISLVDEEIKKAKEREDELKKERAGIHTRENFLASPNLLDSAYDKQDDFPIRCKSSPSSPMKSCRMDRSALSCDHRFPEYSSGRRKSAMALRWEAGEFANN